MSLINDVTGTFSYLQRPLYSPTLVLVMLLTLLMLCLCSGLGRLFHQVVLICQASD